MFLLASVLLLFSWTSASADDNPKQLTLEIKLGITQGDPLGDRKEQTRVVADSRVVTLEGKAARVFSGREQPQLNDQAELVFHQVGLSLQARGRALKRGLVFLDLTLSHTKASAEEDGRMSIKGESAQSVGAFPAGEMIKLSLPKKGEAQIWAEIRVTVQDR